MKREISGLFAGVLVWGLSLLIGSVVLAGCASSGGGSGGGAAMKTRDEAGELTSEEARAAAELATSTEPLTGTSATLWVHGLSCPLCSSNIDSVLSRVEGVKGVHVDLEKGVVHVGLTGDAKPSRKDLWKAVDSSGFTLVKVESK